MDGVAEFDICKVFVVGDDFYDNSNEIIDKAFVDPETTDPAEDTDLNISSKDFPHICRTCLNQGELISIFSSCIKHNDDEIQVAELLKDCAKLKVTDSDGLPENVCVICVRKLMKMYTFCKRCRLNEIALKLVQSTPHDLESEEEKALSDFEEKYDITDDFLKGNEPTSDLKSGSKLSYITKEPEPADSVNDGSESSHIRSSNKIKSDHEDKMSKSSYKKSKSKDEKSRIGKSDSQVERSSVKCKKVRKPLTYKCKICLKMCNNFGELQAHRKETQHWSYLRMLSCKVCHKIIRAKSMYAHMPIHTQEKPHKCTFCKKEFSQIPTLRRHMMIHTGERPYICELCGKSFNQSSILQGHRKKIHNKVGYDSEDSSLPGQYLCSPCGQSFSRFYRYHAHMKMHDPDHQTHQTTPKIVEPVTCEECGKCLPTETALYKHKQIHGDKSFLCSFCGKVFNKNVQLQVHIRIHTGEKPYSCKICKKSFSQTASCKSHERSHTGETPFMCDECGKTFSYPQHLKYHLRLHTGEKSYNCNYCGKAFTLKGNLVVHMRRHTKDTPYLCNVCGKGFYDSSSRNKHKRMKHKIDVKVQVNKIRKTW